MSKYKIETSIDVDFQKFFDEIPDGLFSSEDRACDDYYESECIYNLFRDMITNSLMRKMNNMTTEHKDYHKHHDDINVAVANSIKENLKITKII